MQDDEVLFSWDTPEIEPERIVRAKISDDQVAQICGAFDRAGIIGQEQRSAFVRERFVRPIGGLEDLFADETKKLLTNIFNESVHNEPSTGSAWDNRDEDTWIDKL